MIGEIIETGKPVDVIVFGDTHRCPSDPQEFDDVLLSIGDYIYDAAPQYAFHLGDLGDFRSVNAYKGGALMGGDGSDEGHDVVDDVETWRTGLRLIKSRWNREADRHTRAGHKERIPETRFGIFEGNHEEMFRLRLPRKHRSLRSLPRLKELNLPAIAEEEGFDYFSFLTPLGLNGLVSQHYYQGLNPKVALGIQTVQAQNGMSSVFGHTHRFEVRHWRDAFGRSRSVINTGCTKHPSRLKRHESSGILHIKGLMDGVFKFEWITIDQLLRDYARKTRGYRQ